MNMTHIFSPPFIKDKKKIRNKKNEPTETYQNDDRTLLCPRLHLTIYPRERTEVRLGATTEWMALCQLLSAINRIRSLFPLFAHPLSLSVRLLPTLLLSLMFLSHA